MYLKYFQLPLLNAGMRTYSVAYSNILTLTWSFWHEYVNMLELFVCSGHSFQSLWMSELSQCLAVFIFLRFSLEIKNIE